MSANSPDPAPRGESTGDETRTPEANLSEEFSKFGRELSALLRTLRESPRAKEVEVQVTQALREMERQVGEALNTARDRAQVQDWKGTIKGAATTASDEAQHGLARGLHALNERLAKVAQEVEHSRAQSGGEKGPGDPSGPPPPAG